MSIHMAITNRHPGYGDFTTGLYVMPASSSGPLSFDASIPMGETRDIVAAVPVLVWRPPPSEPVAAIVGELQAKIIGAIELSEGTFPLTATPSEGVAFTIEENRLKVRGSDRHIGLLGSGSFQIEPRLAWFLERGSTLGVCIQAPGKIWGTTVTNNLPFPLIAAHSTTIQSKALNGILEHSKSWNFVRPFNQSLLSDRIDAPDHRYRIYGAAPDSADLPRLVYEGDCLGCGGKGKSNEHCVPKWITSVHGVIPVTAPVFCEPCNHHFGSALERPIAALATRKQWRETVNTPLFSLWAAKTAFTLSAASGVILDKSWMFDVRQGQIPAGFEVFAVGGAPMTSGYVYAISQFNRLMADAGTFLFTFATDQVTFLVARTSPALRSIPVFPRVHPTATPAMRQATGMVDVGQLHRSVQEMITQVETDFSPSLPRPVNTRRT